MFAWIETVLPFGLFKKDSKKNLWIILIWRITLVLLTIAFILQTRIITISNKYRQPANFYTIKKDIFSIFKEACYDSFGDMCAQLFALFAFGYEYLVDCYVGFKIFFCLL